MLTDEGDQGPLHVIVRLQRTYPDGPVVVTLRSAGKRSFGPRRLGLFTEFALRRRLAETQKRTREQVEGIVRELLREPYEHEFAEQFRGSWAAALNAWNGVGTTSEVRPLSWSCRKARCPNPAQRVFVAALPDQVVLLRCAACGSLRRVDPALPEENP